MRNPYDNRRGGSTSGQRPPFQGASGGGRSPPDGKERIKDALKSNDTVRYCNEKGELRPDLLDQEAQAAAIKLENITTTQLRRFFEQVGAIKRRLDVDASVSDSEILAQVAFLKASAAYAAGRSGDNEPMLEFVVKHANSVKARSDFLQFHRHFETVIAFHKVYGKDKKDN